VGIELLDHVVVASGGFCSMADRLHGAPWEEPDGGQSP
jgi:hypothetical protein